MSINKISKYGKVREMLPNKSLVIFDVRIYQTPTLMDVCAQLLWRENDAIKNSKSILAQKHFKHHELKGLDGNALQDKLLFEKGINWNDTPTKFKRGVYIQRKEVSRPYLVTEIEDLPMKHVARTNPNMVVTRK
jgi:tRNA(His) guanylyltransferase